MTRLRTASEVVSKIEGYFKDEKMSDAERHDRLIKLVDRHAIEAYELGRHEGEADSSAE